MVNPQRYESILDQYFAEVAAVTKEFEDVLKEQTELLKKLAEHSAGSSIAQPTAQSTDALPTMSEPAGPKTKKWPPTGGASHHGRQPDIFSD